MGYFISKPGFFQKKQLYEDFNGKLFFFFDWILWKKQRYAHTHTYIHTHICTVIHRQTVSLYHNSSVWLDTQDASIWNRNPADLMSVGYLTSKLSSLSVQVKEFYIYIYLHIHLSVTRVLSSWKELCIYMYVEAGNPPLKCSTHGRGGNILSYCCWSNERIVNILKWISQQMILNFEILCEPIHFKIYVYISFGWLVLWHVNTCRVI